MYSCKGAGLKKACPDRFFAHSNIAKRGFFRKSFLLCPPPPFARPGPPARLLLRPRCLAKMTGRYHHRHSTCPAKPKRPENSDGWQKIRKSWKWGAVIADSRTPDNGGWLAKYFGRTGGGMKKRVFWPPPPSDSRPRRTQSSTESRTDHKNTAWTVF